MAAITESQSTTFATAADLKVTDDKVDEIKLGLAGLNKKFDAFVASMHKDLKDPGNPAAAAKKQALTPTALENGLRSQASAPSGGSKATQVGDLTADRSGAVNKTGVSDEARAEGYKALLAEADEAKGYGPADESRLTQWGGWFRVLLDVVEFVAMWISPFVHMILAALRIVRLLYLWLFDDTGHIDWVQEGLHLVANLVGIVAPPLGAAGDMLIDTMNPFSKHDDNKGKSDTLGGWYEEFMDRGEDGSRQVKHNAIRYMIVDPVMGSVVGAKNKLFGSDAEPQKTDDLAASAKKKVAEERAATAEISSQPVPAETPTEREKLTPTTSFAW